MVTEGSIPTEGQPTDITSEATAEEQPVGSFAIQRVYVKDFSFEAPSAPMIFQEDWKPELNLDINTNSDKIADDTYEVVLKVTATVKSGDKTAFIAEVQQAGIFTIKDFEEGPLHHALGSFCPHVLYPYARSVITDAVAKGSFPQLVLAPINFDALYAQHNAEKDAKANGK